MRRVINTTTLRVEKLENTKKLDKSFGLIRYVLPPSFFKDPNKTKYARLHIALKTQLNRPYITFKFDRLDGKPQTVIYALFKKEKGKPLSVPELDLKSIFRYVKHQIVGKPISFLQLELHLVLKLLLTDYFYGGWEKSFVGQGKRYIYVSNSTSKTDEATYYKCLEVIFSGHRDNSDQPKTQYFHVLGQACQFRSLDEDDDNLDRKSMPLYTAVNANGQTTLLQVAENATNVSKDLLLKPFKNPEKRVTIPYHLHANLNRSRGKNLYEFVSRFISYLAQYDIPAAIQQRSVEQFPARKDHHRLPIESMKVQVLSRCFSNPELELQQQLLWDTLQRLHPQAQIIDDISPDSTDPVLILQNYGAKDFMQKGAYEGDDDPKKALYQTFPGIPMQTIDIRPKVEDSDDEEAEPDTQKLEDDISLRLQVSLNELYLKDLLLNQKALISELPGYEEGSPLHKYVFVRRQTDNGIPREVMLVYENNHLAAYDLDENTDRLESILQGLNLKWVDIQRELLKRRFLWDEEGQGIKKGKKLVRYDLVLLPDLALEIEDIRESILYNYSDIEARQNQSRLDRPIEEFYLSGHANLSRFFSNAQIAAYDLYLKQTVKKAHKKISYKRLTKDYGPGIAQRLALPLNKYNKPTFRRLTEMYQHQGIGVLKSEKADELIRTYKGIWFDNENRYVIGDPDPLKDKQASAHKVRQINILTGTGKIDMQLLLSLMDVRFVRHKRFTVYPYQFKLIDLHVEMTRWNSL